MFTASCLGRDFTGWPWFAFELEPKVCHVPGGSRRSNPAQVVGDQFAVAVCEEVSPVEVVWKAQFGGGLLGFLVRQGCEFDQASSFCWSASGRKVQYSVRGPAHVFG